MPPIMIQIKNREIRRCFLAQKGDSTVGIIQKIAECTKLAAEYSSLPCNAESPEAYAPIRARKKELKTRIEELKAEIARYREEELNYDSTDNGNDQGSSTADRA